MNSNESPDCNFIFVYGTLRSDVPKPWPNYAKIFNNLVTTEYTAVARGARLFIGKLYPYIKLDNSDNCVVGKIVSTSQQQFPALLKCADKIELGCGMYERKIINVETQDGRSEKAYVYSGVSGLTDGYEIHTGDFLTTI